MKFYGTSKHAYFSIAPSDDEDVQGVAVMQAMLSLGLAEIVKDAGGTLTLEFGIMQGVYTGGVRSADCPPPSIRKMLYACSAGI